MAPSVLFVGKREADLTLFHTVAARIGVTPIDDLSNATRLLTEGSVAAAVIGEDVSDADASRLIALTRSVQPALPIIVLACRDRERSSEIRSLNATLVELRLLEPALRGALGRDSAHPMLAETDLLLVDDDRPLLRMMDRTLRGRGYTTATASSPASARSLLETTRFKLLIFDVNMPHASGIDLARSIRAGEYGDANRDTPLVFATGDDGASTYESSFDVGAIRYLLKPLDSDRLCETVVGLLHDAA